MKVAIQRIKRARVVIDEGLVSDIKQGLLLLVGVGPDDGQEDLDYVMREITDMRIFSGDMGKMNLSAQDVKGSILPVSQLIPFTDIRKDNRPAFTGAAKPDKAEQLYNVFNEALAQYVLVEASVFGADMYVSPVNDGPAAIILNTRTR